MEINKFSKRLLMKGALSRVPEGPNPPKTNKVSSYMFTKLQKIARKQY
jgi:hypothetical protein